MPYWVGPFLTPTDFDPLADPQPITDAEDVGYISDGVLTTVKGSVFPVAADFNTEPGVPGVANFFRIEGPGVGNQPGLQASPDRCAAVAQGADLSGVNNRSDSSFAAAFFRLSGFIRSRFKIFHRMAGSRSASGKANDFQLGVPRLSASRKLRSASVISS